MTVSEILEAGLGWLVVVIGSIVSVLGAFYAYSGLDYIQVERGWTAVIAGTGVFSAGIIVVAIGILTLQLGRIAKMLKGAAQAFEAEIPVLADAEPQGAEPKWSAEAEPPLTDGLSQLAEPQSVVSAITAPVAAPAVALSYLPKRRKDLSTPEAAPETPAIVSQKITAPALSAEDRISLDWLEEAISDLKEPVVPPQTPPPLPRPEGSSVVSKPSAERKVPAPVAPASQATIVPRQAPAMPEPARTFAPLTQEPAPSEWNKTNPVKPEPAPAETVTPEQVKPVAPKAATPASHHEPSVVGRYEAAGTSYAMYSDGSVEAENEHGVFRFGSMAELRAFIEQGPDKTSKPPQS